MASHLRSDQRSSTTAITEQLRNLNLISKEQGVQK